MKKYNQPFVEETLLTPFTNMMYTVSEGTGDEGDAHAPARRGTLIPD